MNVNKNIREQIYSIFLIFYVCLFVFLVSIYKYISVKRKIIIILIILLLLSYYHNEFREYSYTYFL